jgi:acetolactate synthase-1/2/3 large subunit
MTGADAVADILKREGIEFLFAYPYNPIIEAAAKKDIRIIIVRQERTGLHMADALSRVSSGKSIGVFAMQHGPGTENAFGGVAQAYADSVPIVVLPMGYPRNIINIPPNFNAFLNYRHVTKWIEQVNSANFIPDAMRRAFTQVRNGRPRPVLVEIPGDVFLEDLSSPLDYIPTFSTRTSPDLQEVKKVAGILVKSKRPVIYAGQGVHYAQAWQQLRDLAELLEVPVATSLQGKSAFPETHPLSLGSGGRAVPKTVHHFIQNSDTIFGIGCSFAITNYAIPIPAGKVIIHATQDTADLNKDIHANYALIGDAKLTLEALISEIKEILGSKKRGRRTNVCNEINAIKGEWMARWMPKLTSDEIPLSPYRVLWDLMNTVDCANTIITHDAGSPRDQLSPFWETVTPLSYIGWGKSTQLGYGLGLAMGAKLAEPNKLCINVMGDAAIGDTGMDFETSVRAGIPILTVLFNNFCMAIELAGLPVATEKYRSTDITGNYSEMARAFGGYSERVEKPADVVPAIKRAIQKTKQGKSVLLEFITAKEVQYSIFK